MVLDRRDPDVELAEQPNWRLRRVRLSGEGQAGRGGDRQREVVVVEPNASGMGLERGRRARGRAAPTRCCRNPQRVGEVIWPSWADLVAEVVQRVAGLRQGEMCGAG